MRTNPPVPLIDDYFQFTFLSLTSQQTEILFEMLPSVLRQFSCRHNVFLPSACGCGRLLTRRHWNSNSSNDGSPYVVEPSVMTRRWNSSGDGKKAPTRYVVQLTTMTMQKLDPANYSTDEIPPLVTSYNERGFTIQGTLGL